MARSPEWSPKTTVENQRQIRLKIEPRLGKRRLSKIRASDLDATRDASWRLTRIIGWRGVPDPMTGRRSRS
jgi:hypothetical protein